MGARLAIGACVGKARRYQSGMKILHTSTGIAGIAVLLLSSAVSAQPAQSAAELAQQGDDPAWAITRDLTTDVGPRMAGTDAEAVARRWAVQRLQAMGFTNVREEAFDMSVWVRGTEEAWLTSSLVPQKLAITALGNSASTGPKGIEGEIAYFESFDALDAASDAGVKGKIVFIDHDMKPTQDGSGYGYYGRGRFTGPNVAAKKGAIAIVIRSIGTDHHRNPHAGVTNFDAGVKPIPAGAISNPDADQLVRQWRRPQPVRAGTTPLLKMKLILTPQNLGTRKSGNVIAEVPGRDPKLAPILVGGHLDSWDLGTGAIDDGAGVAIAAAAAKRIMDAGRPLRTIRVVWFGAEEVGLFGGLDYRARHGKEPHYALAESDFGADRIWKVNSKLGADRKHEAEAIAAALAPLGIVGGAYDEAEGSDIGPMIADGMPAVGLSQDGIRYFDIHHTPDDTLDKIDPAQLRQNVAAWTAMLAVLSGGIEPKPAKRR